MISSFANNINTHEGGTHLSGFRSALTRTVNSVRDEKCACEGPEREHHRRRHSRGLDRRHQRQNPASAVRRADQDETGQHGSEGHRRGDSQRETWVVSRGESDSRAAHRRQSDRCRSRTRGGAQGARSRAAERRARRQFAPWQARGLSGTRSGPASSISSRASRQADQPSRDAIDVSQAILPLKGKISERRKGPLRQDAEQRRNQDHDRGARLRHRR